jgi:mono/diheme cytochrome c family protein
MKTTLLIVSAAALLGAGAAVAQTKGDAAAKGKAVFEQCVICHATTNGAKKMGPSLKGLYKKPKMTNGQKPTDASVLAIINKGRGTMPAYAEVLSAAEKAHLLAYLKTL